ncbi:MAG: mannose-1-phosphate guanylyltransferase [Cumulibacter sp.]
MSRFYPVIPAGGSGTRLWPLSRQSSPKFLHRLGADERSLMQLTLARLGPLSPPEQTYVVCGPAHKAAIAEQIPSVPSRNLVVEPAGRNSGPAIALAAAIIHARDSEAVMGSFAADHLISVGDAFRAAVRTGIEVAATGRLVTIGVPPRYAETGYGYIEIGAELGIGPALAVRSFKEKPDLVTAQEYVEDGRHLWNAGMFVGRTADLLQDVRQHAPEIYERVQRVAERWHTDNAAAREILADVWEDMPSISIDHAIVEQLAAQGRVATVPARMGWSDMGEWDTVAELGLAEGSRLAQPRETLLLDSPGSFATSGTGRAVTVVGVPDVVVVETDTCILVVKRSEAQRVKDAVEAWKERGRDDLL